VTESLAPNTKPSLAGRVIKWFPIAVVLLFVGLAAMSQYIDHFSGQVSPETRAFLDKLNASDPPASSAAAPAFVVFVHTGLHGLRITNDTETTWDNCTVTIVGDYAADVPTLKPRESSEVYYSSFQAGGTRLNENDGYGRALRSTHLECSGPDRQRHVARLR
jgi:hypothetical protein